MKNIQRKAISFFLNVAIMTSILMFNVITVNADQISDLTSWYTSMDQSKGWTDLLSNDVTILRAIQASLVGGLTRSQPKQWSGDQVNNWKTNSDSFTWAVKSNASSSYLTAVFRLIYKIRC